MNWQEIWTNLVSFLMSTGVKTVLAILIFIILWKLSTWISKRIAKKVIFKKTDPLVGRFVEHLVSIVIKVLLTVTLIAFVGVPVSSIVAAVASCGVAIGLALQGGLSNLAGGFMLVIMKPFRVDDEITAAGNTGVVREIGIFYTSIVTYDNRHVYIPNGSLTSGVIVNHTAEEKRRVDIVATVAYDSDQKTVEGALLFLARDERALADPKPVVIVSKYGDSSIEFTLRMWCRTEDYWNLLNDTNKKLKKTLDDAGIQIPYPQLDVHMKQ